MGFTLGISRGIRDIRSGSRRRNRSSDGRSGRRGALAAPEAVGCRGQLLSRPTRSWWCRSRSSASWVLAVSRQAMTSFMPYPLEVEVGGATVFVVPVERFERL